MHLKVPYLTDADIEASANALLVNYARRKGIELQPPLLVEDILEGHLGLHLGFDDLRTRLGAPDILGALWIDTKEVMVDQTLDPDEQPSVLTRYRFTLGHEVGHWQLHRELVLARRLQSSLFQQSTGPSIICRTSQQRERIELQADAFAAALLMPRRAVTTHWQRLMGPERLKASELNDRGGAFLAAAAALERGYVSGDARGQQKDVIEAVIRPIAEAFQVSRPAMRIRLEQLGFITHEVDTTMPMFEAI